MNLQEIKKQFPRGAIREIAKRSKTSTGLISRVFNGEIKSPKEPEILQATAEYLAEYKAKKQKAKEALNDALQDI
ncbi:hypothetical protein EZS27_016701 [termite gut metagenome]|uniref:HTH cro/C1-type domain-containing protein n=1 Tax=termite gut metagenome TaxID=433724 RepID=A0A5J4RMX4_9ZZZZ